MKEDTKTGSNGESKPFTLKVPQDLWDAIDQEAKSRRTTKSEAVRQILFAELVDKEVPA